MELNEILKGLETKISEAKKMTGLHSKHFIFRNWHATVMQLLRDLPSSYLLQVNEFKKLNYEETGFKRGRKFLSSPDNSKFLDDLDSSVSILKDIIKKDKPKDKKKESKPAADISKKPDKPIAKKNGSKKPAKKAGPRKAKDAKGVRKPAKTGTSSTRKKN